MTDIHGCYDNMIELMDKINFKPTEDRFIFLGDAMDRGPKSYATLMYLVNLKDAMGDRCTLLRGNHEQLFISKMKHGDWIPWPEYNGGERTIYSFGRYYCSLKDGDEEDFNNAWQKWVPTVRKYFKDFYLLENGILYSHAGCYLEDIKQFDKKEWMWDRSCAWYGSNYPGFQVLGHTPYTYPRLITGLYGRVERLKYGRRYPLKGSVDIDTYSSWYYLTCMIIENNYFYLERA